MDLFSPNVHRFRVCWACSSLDCHLCSASPLWWASGNSSKYWNKVFWRNAGQFRSSESDEFSVDSDSQITVPTEAVMGIQVTTPGDRNQFHRFYGVTADTGTNPSRHSCGFRVLPFKPLTFDFGIQSRTATARYKQPPQFLLHPNQPGSDPEVGKACCCVRASQFSAGARRVGCTLKMLPPNC